MHLDKKSPDHAEEAPTASPFAVIGGEESIKALVERFYDLIDL